jgi:hypothetical protein
MNGEYGCYWSEYLTEDQVIRLICNFAGYEQRVPTKDELEGLVFLAEEAIEGEGMEIL